MDRPLFDKILSELKTDDTLMVTKLDQSARDILENQK